MSTLQVQTLQGPTSGADSNTVRVADGHNLHAKGHVVQTVFTTSTTASTSTSIYSWVPSTMLDTSFTPKFSNSLIVVEVNLQVRFSSNTANTGCAIRIKSGSNVIGGTPTSAAEAFYYAGTTGAICYTRYAKTVEDDSGNTGARTYSFQTKMYAGTDEVTVSGASPSTMKITEVAQ